MRFSYQKLDDEEEGAIPSIQMESITEVTEGGAPSQEPASTVEETSVTQDAPQDAAPAASEAPAPAESSSQQTTVEADLPPKYEQPENEPLPTYVEATNGTPVTVLLLAEEALVEGRPVGSFGTFLFTLLVAWFFGLLGFLASFLMSTSHAGRNGARAGLGLNAVQFAFYARGVLAELYYTSLQEGSEGDESIDEFGSGWTLQLCFIYILMALGSFLFVRACHDYFAVRHFSRTAVAGIH